MKNKGGTGGDGKKMGYEGNGLEMGRKQNIPLQRWMHATEKQTPRHTNRQE
jgi:hypothetical protein